MQLFVHNDTKHILCIIMKTHESLLFVDLLFSNHGRKGIMIHIESFCVIYDTKRIVKGGCLHEHGSAHSRPSED